MQQLTGDPAIFTAINQYPTLIVRRGTHADTTVPVRIHEPDGFDFGTYFLMAPEATVNDRYEIGSAGIGIHDGPLIGKIRARLAEKQIPLLADCHPVVIVEQWDDGAVKVMQGTVHVTGYDRMETGYIE